MSDAGWRDITSYSRGERGCTPRSFQIDFEELRLVVTRRICYPGAWVATCEPFFELQRLRSEGIDDAKAEAMQNLADELKLATHALKTARAALGRAAPSEEP